MAKPKTLRFGIQSLDRLIGSIEDGKSKKYGVDLSQPAQTPGDVQPAQTDDQITSSICLAGPDGTGKSVFSLHLASHYLADCLDASGSEAKRDRPKVIYISTDLTYTIALRGWHSFELAHPLERREPLLELGEGRKPARDQITIDLRQSFASEDIVSDKSITNYLEDSGEKRPKKKRAASQAINGEVCFVDLATRTAGDDWGFVHRLLSMLDKPKPDMPRHLVVLDAVEGFETLVGDLNAFGEKSSRRSRIAQVMRLAASKAHLLLVVEERREERFPEEFVTDVVVRLRNVETGRYLRRTVEIEKARGQLHVRGQHPFVIRDGKGSTTGNQDNADDLEVKKPGGKHQAYVHVFLSPNYTSREIMTDKYDPRQSAAGDRFAAFGVPYLDNMLGGVGEKAERQRDNEGEFDTRGLPCGSATALVGDSLTQKSHLGKAFLSRAFYPYGEELYGRLTKHLTGRAAKNLERKIEQAILDVAQHKGSAKEAAKQLVPELERQVKEILGKSRDLEPVTVMFTTQDVNYDDLAEQFYEWLKHEDPMLGREVESETPPGQQKKRRRVTGPDGLRKLVETGIVRFAKRFRKYQKKHGPNYEAFKKDQSYKASSNRFKNLLVTQVQMEVIKSHTICRRFEIHDIPSAILMHIFQRNIEKAQRIMLRLKEDQGLPNAGVRYRASWRIRVVIDDLNSFRNIFPEIRDDALMLPSLLFMLGREGVTSLIIDTQSSGSPDLFIAERFDSSVRELVQNRIYTWRLPFYGENRVAISLIPPISHEYRGVIRELRSETKDQRRTDRALTVDPHFELYMGLERGQPQPVPLEIKLYAETPSFNRYIDREEQLFAEIFTPVKSPRKDPPHIIVPVEVGGYETLRDSCHLQRDTRIDHTTIMQVDEFWWLRRPRQRLAGAFRPQWNYLNSITASRDDSGAFKSEPVADPFGVFQPGGVREELNNSKAGKRVHAEPGQPELSSESVGHGAPIKQLRRLDFFDDRCGYDLGEISEAIETGNGPGEEQYVDRVPFTWDFGFMLCNGYAWAEAARERDKDKDEGGALVKRVWHDQLRQVNKPGKAAPRPVEWRDFLKASKFVAEFQSYKTSTPATPFDFTMLTPESFSCLILEMWFSEIYRSLRKHEGMKRGPTARPFREKRANIVEMMRTRRWSAASVETSTLLDFLKAERTKDLNTILDDRINNVTIDGYSLELYKVWLLLLEVINFSELVDSSSHLNFEFKSRDVSPQAVSARHWYKTAGKFIDSLTPEQLEYNWIPTRSPGHFSVRADWFLAVAGGSRSSRLGDHALDLLSSQRANVTRLQEGIGLPTRRLFDRLTTADKGHQLRSRLICVPEEGKPLTNVNYEDLVRIGASEDAASEEFYWLWRSGIAAYNRHSRIWHKWLNRTLLWWNSWHQRYGSNWTGGFEVYDLLDTMEFRKTKQKQESEEEKEVRDLESWKQFDDLRNILIAELEQVTISSV